VREHAFPSYDCKRGECGVCLTRVLAGEPVHRDVYQTEFMTVCVSRAKTPSLVLDGVSRSARSNTSAASAGSARSSSMSRSRWETRDFLQVRDFSSQFFND
jgi:hypothetical protein